MSNEYDVIVIGSGFGGAITAYRMAEKGKRVCLLERGSKYGMHEFPRRIHEVKKDFFWDPKDKQYGIMEFRDYSESDLMSVSASGLGGGSLIYANVLMKMPPEFFEGWPANINRETLDPYYSKVLEMMEASPYPFDTDPYYTDTPKTKYMREITPNLSQAEDATAKPEFIFPDLAINFKGDYPGEQTKNIHGATQSKCNKCGECDIGCNIHAKNSLDLNYIYAAQHKYAATIKTETLATVIKPDENDGYEVHTQNSKDSSDVQILKGKKVFVCAGTLGTNKLLLQMKKQNHLPNISNMLGQKWCGNGDLEGSVFNSDKELLVSKGPVITGAIKYKFKDYPDGFKHGAFIQDAGIPTGLVWYLAGKIPSFKTFGNQFMFALYMAFSTLFRLFGIKIKYQMNIGDMVADMLDQDRFSRHAFLLLGMGRDRSTGHVELRDDGEPIIKWSMGPSRLHYSRVRNEMRKISDELNGTFIDNPLTHVDKIIAVHPIGGCVIGNNESDGVVDKKGEVFNYPGLHVVDASIIPTSIGPNPSLTIGALAEYIAAQIE